VLLDEDEGRAGARSGRSRRPLRGGHDHPPLLAVPRRLIAQSVEALLKIAKENGKKQYVFEEGTSSS
jgi:hypothetical protein